MGSIGTGATVRNHASWLRWLARSDGPSSQQGRRQPRALRDYAVCFSKGLLAAQT